MPAPISPMTRKLHCTMEVPTPKHCKICEKAWPLADQFFHGWTVLILKDHRTELFQLTQGERGQLMEEVSWVGESFTQVFPVRKVNSELLGNQVPHIHWHVVPRLRDDPDPLKPVWNVSHEPVRLTDEDLNERLRLLRGALGIS